MAAEDAMSAMARAMKDLSRSWQEVRGVWKDARGAEFEAKYIDVWERDYRSTIGQVENMVAYLGQVRRDCE